MFEGPALSFSRHRGAAPASRVHKGAALPWEGPWQGPWAVALTLAVPGGAAPVSGVC